MSDLLLTQTQYERFLDGLRLTVTLLAMSVAFGLFIALFVGIARLSPRRWVRGLALGYVEFARGISSVVLLFVFAFTIPILLGFGQANKLILASVALGLNMGGYGAEIVRGAIQAIPKGQIEASIALNLTNTQRLRLIVLPQAMRIILPPMGNLTIEILKGTALVSLVGMSDLAEKTLRLRSQVRRGLTDERAMSVVFLNTLIIYFILAQLLNALFRSAEWYFDRQFKARKEAAQTEAPKAFEPALEGGSS